jgi:hypothetical protein
MDNTNSKKSYKQKQKTNNYTEPSSKNQHRQLFNIDSSSNQSPQPLQVPKNSPNLLQSLKGKKQESASISQEISTSSNFSSLEKNPDKVLMNLLKKNTCINENLDKKNDILDLLNKKPTATSKNTVQPKNILDSLFSSQQETSMPTQVTRHFPKVLTVQELELNQIKSKTSKSPKKSSKKSNPIRTLTDNKTYTSKKSNSSMSNTSTGSDSSSSCKNIKNSHEPSKNTSDAYKQLVKNLNNHPLSTPPLNLGKILLSNSGNNANDELLTQINKIKSTSHHQSHNLNQQKIDEANFLKQFLNLKKTNNKSEETEKTAAKQHIHHHSKSSRLTSNSDFIFPTVNPKERPFESFFTNQIVQKPSSASLPSAHSSGSIENLILKMNASQLKERTTFANQYSEQQNFNSLLTKLMPSLSNQLHSSQSQN